MMLRPLAAAMLLTATTLASAAPLNLKQGQTVVLASFYELRGCQALAAPRLRLTENAALGSATIVRTDGNTGGSGPCGYLAVPVVQVVYRADKPGRETVRWQVQYQTKGKADETGGRDIVVYP